MYLLPPTPSPNALRREDTWTFRLPSSTTVFGQTRAFSSSLLTISPLRYTKAIRISTARLPRRTGRSDSSNKRWEGRRRNGPNAIARVASGRDMHQLYSKACPPASHLDEQRYTFAYCVKMTCHMRTTDISNSERVTAVWTTASLRRLRPVGVEDFLRRHFRHDHPRHFRIKPANAVAANDKVGRVEHMPHDKVQYCAVDLRPFRLH
jgi:hypothetical protein